MRRLIALPFLLAASTAFAGGLTAPVVETEPVATAAAPTAAPGWGGVYVGASLGRAFGGDDKVGIFYGGNAYASPGTLELQGTTLDLRLGWRVAQGPMVYGVELSNTSGPVEDTVANATYGAKSELNSAQAIKGQIGWAVGSRTLAFGSVGFVSGDFDYRVASATRSLSGNFRNNGYVVGVGVEHQITDRWSLRGDWEYMNFGKTNLGDETILSTEATPDFHKLSVGLNFRF